MGEEEVSHCRYNMSAIHERCMSGETGYHARPWRLGVVTCVRVDLTILRKTVYTTKTFTVRGITQIMRHSHAP